MTRLILTFVVWMNLVCTGWASLTPRRETSPFDREIPRIPDSVFVAKTLDQEAESEFVVTRRTEITLNGKPCRYEDVPEYATIVRMKVAADKKTALKIDFRTQR
jgi:hypothetical protein